jgi:dTDP-glucose 4,6-dehydratase
MPSVLVTGGLGFIGASYVNLLHGTRPEGWDIVVLDACLYAADEGRLAGAVRGDESVHLVRCNLRSWSRILQLLAAYDVRQVVHFAAYSHVGASFLTPLEFTEDNVLGTQCLLECCRLHGGLERFICVSTDEVYGDAACGADAKPFAEDAPLNPTNPYSASKAAAELMARTYGTCFGLPVIVTRGNNVIGPRQHREKLLPAVAARVAAGRRARVEGDGLQLRGFLFIDDVAAAIETVRQRGAVGETYNVGGTEEHTVLQLVEAVLRVLRPGERLADWVEHVSDRPYQDRRYHVDAAKLRALGWRQSVRLDEAVRRSLEAESP